MEVVGALTSGRDGEWDSRRSSSPLFHVLPDPLLDGWISRRRRHSTWGTVVLTEVLGRGLVRYCGGGCEGERYRERW